MPGMNAGSGQAGAALAAAFRSALTHQLLIVALIFGVVGVAWAAARTWVRTAGGLPVGPVGPAGLAAGSAGVAAGREPVARWVLRVGFGSLWLVDGILQAQPQMPGGLADHVIAPAAATSPGWVQSLVRWGVNVWDYHPVVAAASCVWIQVGIGLAMLLAARGLASRLAALSGVAWGLLIWAFGEAFGGIFAPGSTVLFGTPGAALLYAVAGVFLALPDRAWERRRADRFLAGATGAFFLGMAAVQAWPGNGFWAGTAGGSVVGGSAGGSVGGVPGPVAAMAADMADTPQPRALAALVSGFGDFAQSHGVVVNLVAVIALAAGGAALGVMAVRPRFPGAARLRALLRRVRLGRAAVAVLAVFCLADWVLIQDFGFFGGLGTDPNSMLPLILLLSAAYLGPAVPETETETETAETPSPASPSEPPPDDGPSGTGRRAGARWGHRLGRAFAAVPACTVAALGAFGAIAVGAAPMALASANRTADPVVAQSIAGSAGAFSVPAPNFTLTSQDGRVVALSSLRGKVVLLTFLDPVCTTDCPLIAQEMRSADQMLGARAADTELVAVVANPAYLSTAYTQAFTRQERLGSLPNWLFLTGSLRQLQPVWNRFGIQVENLPAGAMAAHNDLAFVISAQGVIQTELNADPGPGTGATMSSFANLMASAVLRSMAGGR